MKRRLRLSYVLIPCLVFILAVAVPLMASAEVREEWVTRYTYDQPDSNGGSASALAVDASGNVYVTGESWGSHTGEDYATVKYDSDGNQLWRARYNGPESWEDSARALAVDATGNVYVTGESLGSGTDLDYATVKYDTDGNELWVARLPYNGDDSASAIAVDASGNVYVTGSIRIIYSADEIYEYECDHYATVKYDTDGNQLWVAWYYGPDYPLTFDTEASALAVDASGNVYVTGKSTCELDMCELGISTFGTDDNYATVKYDTDGNELWAAQYNGPGNDDDSASALAVDASGNVYVTGKSWGSGTDYDYATVKYDTDGNELWAARYNGPGNDDDFANALAMDASGNIYVTGKSIGSGSWDDYATVKYDTDGNELWVARYNGPGNDDDSASALAVDTSGNVYVTGESWDSGTGYDYATIKYDTDGSELWVARYNGPGDDSAWNLAVDASGNVYVTGRSVGSGTGDDYATAKYDTDGNELWVARYNGPENSRDEAFALAVDASGNVYVTGRSAGSGTNDDYATVKYDTDGNELWVARYNGPENEFDLAFALAVDASGNVYVTGWSLGSGTGIDYATVKYDSDGNELWVARYNGPENGDDVGGALAVDASGNVYVSGYSLGSGTGDDYATVKYDTDGNELWVARYNGPENGDDFAWNLAVDASGNIYVSGRSIGSGTGEDYATVKYDTDGNELWVARYNGPGNDVDEAYALAVDASGNVYVTGASIGSGTNCDYATVKYDTDGNELWVARYNGPGNGDDSAGALAVDASGNVYVTGGSVGSGPGYDYTTVQYDTDGNELWVARYNGPGNGDDFAYHLAVDASGNVYVTGKSLGSGTDDDYATVKYGESEDVKIELPAGWSMISLPVTPAVSTLTTLFPDAVVVYRYQKGAGYVRVTGGENLEVGMGYWILLDNPQTYVITGTAITEYTMSVADGWYMIGGCTLPAQTMVTSGSIAVIYEYMQGSGYKRVPGSEPLERGKGYWILFSNTSGGTEFTASASGSQ